MTAPAALEEPGRVLAGRYRVEGPLGAGGMGIVYLVTDLGTGEPAAVKLLDTTRGDPAMLEQRFAREIAAVQRLTSRHAVRLTDAGTLGDGRHFMAMEYLRGEDLRATLKREGRLEPARAIGLILGACEAIAEAHSLGIVHRDLKPANLFVECLPDGRECLKVLDFGISKLPQETIEELALTATGTVLGSPVYMSPEQMTSSRSVDARTDIWALGMVMYQLLSGAFPYQAEGLPALCAKVLTDEPRPLSDVAPVPPLLAAVVMRCLSRNPAHRFASVGELAAALASFLADDHDLVEAATVVAPARPSLEPPPTRAPDPPAPRRAIWLAGALVGIGAGVLYLVLKWPGAEPDRIQVVSPAEPELEPAPGRLEPEALPSAPAPATGSAPGDASPPEPAESATPLRRHGKPKSPRQPRVRGEFDSPLPP